MNIQEATKLAMERGKPFTAHLNLKHLENQETLELYLQIVMDT